MERINSKTQLTEIGMVLFREHGFSNVTILEICKTAGVTRNAFYYHFADKEDLLCYYFADLIPSQNALFEQILSLSSDWEKLWRLFEVHLQLMESEGVDITRALMKASLDTRDTIVKEYVLTNTWCVPLIQNCIQSGIIDTTLSAEEINFLLTRILLGIIVSWCNKNGEFALIPVFQKAINDFLRPNTSKINPAK